MYIISLTPLTVTKLLKIFVHTSEIKKKKKTLKPSQQIFDTFRSTEL